MGRLSRCLRLVIVALSAADARTLYDGALLQLDGERPNVESSPSPPLVKRAEPPIVPVAATLQSPADRHTDLQLQYLARRSSPRASKCSVNEVYRGRYCDRRGGRVDMWYEQCYLPPAARQPPGYVASDPIWDEIPDAEDPDVPANEAWREYLEGQMGVATRECPPQSSEICGAGSFPPALPRDGTINYFGHACPRGYTCVQTMDSDYLPYIFCRKLSQYKRVLTGTWLEPLDDWSAYSKVETLEIDAALKGYQMTEIGRKFVIPQDMQHAAVSVVVFDPETMETVDAHIKVTHTELSGPKEARCMGWRYFQGPTCMVDQLYSIAKGQVWDVRVILNDRANRNHIKGMLVTIFVSLATLTFKRALARAVMRGMRDAFVAPMVQDMWLNQNQPPP